METLTHSRGASFKSCRKRHWFEFELGLRPIINARALRMGTAHHAGLDAWKKTGSVDAAVEAARAAYLPDDEPPF